MINDELQYVEREPTKFELLTKNYSTIDGERFKIKVFNLNEKEVKIAKLRDMFNGTYECSDLISGDYVQLIDKDAGQCVMSNTYMEEVTNSNFVYDAKGDILIAGLGLGLIVQLIQDKSQVNSILIIEKYQEVIDLVSSQIKFNSKVQIIQGDIFEYSSNKKFDVIYFDIWNTICADNYSEMKKLNMKFRSYKKSKECLMFSWRDKCCKKLYFGNKKWD